MTSVGSESMNRHFESTSTVSIRQTRRGCFQEILGCEAKSEFKWFKTDDGQNVQFATSLADSECLPRILCKPCHAFEMVAKEEGTEAEILTMSRPWACPAGGCKCDCPLTKRQEMTFTSAGQNLGTLKEDFYCCLPSLTLRDANQNEVYIIHPPSCCGGMCYNCFAGDDGNVCMRCLGCTIPFYVFKAGEPHGDGAEHHGKIVKLPKSLASELFTDADAFDITFPKDAGNVEKALLSGSAVLINEMFFETDNDQ